MKQFAIQLKEYMSKTDYAKIRTLEEICTAWDGTALKLELDYKLAVAEEVTGKETERLQQVNSVLYYADAELIAYLGVDCFGGPGSDIEVNGMVHPEYRRKGIFRQMTSIVMDEWRRRDSGDLLLLCDRKSTAGQAFMHSLNLPLNHAEYEMYLNQQMLKPEQIKATIEASGIELRKATNQDAREVAQQNAIYFGEAFSEDQNEWLMPETEEKRGLTIYLAMLAGECIGKVHLQLNGETGGIYGLGVVPAYRGKGYGRAVLLDAVEKLKAAGAKNVMLQVAAENSNALGLYESCGFETTSTMDYFVVKRL